MKIDEEQWLRIQGLATFGVRGAPKAVVVALASIMIDARGVDVWPSMDTTASSTTWTCWIVTETSLGHVQVEYGKYLYDQDAERDQELTPSAWSSWVRPLATVTGIRFGALYEAENKPGIFEPAEAITVSFADGEIAIPQGPVPLNQRAELDHFLKAIRVLANF